MSDTCSFKTNKNALKAVVEFHRGWCPCSLNICLKERLDNIWLAVPGGSFGITFQIRDGPLSRKYCCSVEFITTKIVPRHGLDSF